MRHPFQLRAIYWGGFLLLVSLAIPGHAEPPAAPVKKPNLEHLAKLPASEFTKIVNSSRSPDKRLAIGVGSLDGSKPKWEQVPPEYDDGTSVLAYDEAADHAGNYLIDVGTNRVTAVLDAKHFGTRDHYNHESAKFVWSANSRWLVEVQSWKWCTAVCSVHRVSPEGRLLARLDFLPLAEKAALAQLRKQAPKLTEEQRRKYAVTIEDATISNDGKLTAKLRADAGKDENSEYVNLSVAVKLEATKDGTLSAQVIKAEPIKEEAAERSSE